MKKTLLVGILVATNVLMCRANNLSQDLSALQAQLNDLQKKLGELQLTKTPPPLPLRGLLKDDTRYQWLQWLRDGLQSGSREIKKIALSGPESDPGLQQYLQYFTDIQADLARGIYVETDLPAEIKLLGRQIKRRIVSTQSSDS